MQTHVAAHGAEWCRSVRFEAYHSGFTVVSLQLCSLRPRSWGAAPICGSCSQLLKRLMLCVLPPCLRFLLWQRGPWVGMDSIDILPLFCICFHFKQHWLSWRRECLPHDMDKGAQRQTQHSGLSNQCSCHLCDYQQRTWH